MSPKKNTKRNLNYGVSTFFCGLKSSITLHLRIIYILFSRKKTDLIEQAMFFSHLQVLFAK